MLHVVIYAESRVESEANRIYEDYLCPDFLPDCIRYVELRINSGIYEKRYQDVFCVCIADHNDTYLWRWSVYDKK